MPRFMDIHENMPPMPPEQIAAVKESLSKGEVNEFGMRGLDVLVAEGGTSYCLSEAPSKEAVLSSHQALGLEIPEGNVIQVTSLRDS